MKNIWLYGLDKFDKTKILGFVKATTKEKAIEKVYEMYNDFGMSDYWLKHLFCWEVINDENYREDYPDVMEINY